MNSLQTSLKRFALAVCLVCALSLAGAVVAESACVPGDIVCELTPSFNALANQVTTVGSTASSTLTKTGQNLTATLDIQGKVQVLETFKNNLVTINDDFQTIINQGQDLLQYYQANDLAELNQFLAGDGSCSGACAEFRGQLIDLVSGVESSYNAITHIQRLLMTLPDGTLPPVIFPKLDLSPLKQTLANVPGLALFPIHKALTIASADEVSNCGGCNPTLEAVVNALNTVGSYENLPDDFGRALSHCPTLAAPGNKQVLTEIKWGLQTLGVIGEAVGGIMQAFAKNNVNAVNAGVSVAGEVNLTIKVAPVSTVGKVLSTLGQMCRVLAGAVGSEVHQCTIEVQQDEILCWMKNGGRRLWAQRNCAAQPLFSLPDQGW